VEVPEKKPSHGVRQRRRLMQYSNDCLCFQ